MKFIDLFIFEHMNIKLLLLSMLLLMMSGCVHYKYPTRPDGTQIQIGSYMESSGIYTKSFFICTEKGKLVSDMNKRYECLHP